nr:hypothetical protein CFP56_10169 [Quercus suber]
MDALVRWYGVRAQEQKVHFGAMPHCIAACSAISHRRKVMIGNSELWPRQAFCCDKRCLLDGKQHMLPVAEQWAKATSFVGPRISETLEWSVKDKHT